MHNKAKLCHFSLGYEMILAASVLFSCFSRADAADLKFCLLTIHREHHSLTDQK